MVAQLVVFWGTCRFGIQKQMDLVYIVTSCFFKIQFNIIILFKPKSVSCFSLFSIPCYNFVCTSSPPPYLLRSSQCRLASLPPSNYMWRKVQILKLPIMQYSPVSRYFVLGSECSFQHPVLKHRQSIFVIWYGGPSFVPIGRLKSCCFCKSNTSVNTRQLIPYIHECAWWGSPQTSHFINSYFLILL
jgi:hypothetical protein